MGSPGQPANNNSSWVIVLIVIGFSFATGCLIGFLAKDVAFTDHEAALHEAAGLAPAGATGGGGETGGSLTQLLLPKGKKWPGVWAWRRIWGSEACMARRMRHRHAWGSEACIGALSCHTSPTTHGPEACMSPRMRHQHAWRSEACMGRRAGPTRRWPLAGA